jgi:hypothetical protein
MGFHRRHIDNDQVIEIYRKEGIQGVEDWYTKGVDALVTEEGLASLITDLMDLVEVDEIAKWNMISEEISNESIKKGF